eukprot:GHRR01030015.1.p1 GENE.GHRR01030015.1~~GHRR01030015.1.p1  ORF type:complete len:182 (-),score=38.01 GHRR01030015.1:323-868(-)
MTANSQSALRSCLACDGQHAYRWLLSGQLDVSFSSVPQRCCLFLSDCLSACHVAGVTVQEDRLLECIMLRLRTADGLRLHELQQQFGNGVVSALMPIIRKHTEVGLMQVYECPEHLQSLQPHTRNGLDLSGCQGLTYGVQHLLQQGQQCSVRLTDPAGFLVSNDIIADIFAGLDRAKVLLA